MRRQHKTVTLVTLTLVLGSIGLLSGADHELTATRADMREAGLIVGNATPGPTDGVLRYDGLGRFIDRMVPEFDPVSGLTIPCCLTFGPDENLYVSNLLAGNVLRFNGVTGAFIDTFIPSGSGGLQFPLYLLFHRGSLYVGDTAAGAIRRYDAKTGAFLGNLIPEHSQGLGGLSDLQGFGFGPNGDLYAVASVSNRVLQYDGQSGVFIREFVPGSGGLQNPSGLIFGADSRMYIGNFNSGEVRRYDLRTGGYEVFIAGGGTLGGPVGIQFGPDGDFYATSLSSSAILRYDGRTGEFRGALVPTGRGGLTGPRTMAWKATTTVCHHPPRNRGMRHTLTIGYLSARDHLAHGDTLGACQ